jgi:hypothetical protein
MPKANTSVFCSATRPSDLSVNSMVYRTERFGTTDAITKGRNRWLPAGIQIQDFGDQEFHMFEGKNNRLLDSFSFRLALMVAIFAAWSGAGYLLLSLS